jgi:hypothetical protein
LQVVISNLLLESRRGLRSADVRFRQKKRTSELFLLAFSLRFHRLRSALVIVSDPPHDRIGVLALEVLGDAENFLGAKTPIV